MRPVAAGKFITLEGIEGSGKTEQAQLLGRELERRGLSPLVTQQPGGTRFGRQVRDILLRRGPDREPLAELLLYLADRHQHLREVIEPALRQGRYVVCDRYHDATVAYQGYGRGIDLQVLDTLASILRLGTPDLTLVLEVDIETGLRRAQRRNTQLSEEDWGRFEEEGLDFHRRVMTGYRELARLEPERIVLVDASGEPDKVAGRLVAVLQERGLLE